MPLPYTYGMFLILFPAFGVLMLVSVAFLAARAERDRYCDHGPSDYDSYCPKCGIDS